MNKPEEKEFSEMCDLELEAGVSFLLGVLPKSEEVTIYEDLEDE